MFQWLKSSRPLLEVYPGLRTGRSQWPNSFEAIERASIRHHKTALIFSPSRIPAHYWALRCVHKLNARLENSELTRKLEKSKRDSSRLSSGVRLGAHRDSGEFTTVKPICSPAQHAFYVNRSLETFKVAFQLESLRVSELAAQMLDSSLFLDSRAKLRCGISSI